MNRRRTVLLGSTGSIGEKAVRVAERYADRIRVDALAAHRSAETVCEQAERLGVTRIVMGDAAAAAEVARLRPGTRVDHGPEALAALARDPDIDLVVNGVVGRAGLEASLAAAETGKTLALANKESLVLAGELLMERARASGARILPVDSEHAGLFQALQGRRPGEVARLLITASGGPFRGRPAGSMHHVTPEEALDHPIWPMGPRITVDSASLFNKGLEVIETHRLFDIPLDRIDVVVHPQSVVHALVELVDGSVIAQLAAPDMLLPVQYAMSYPDRWEADAPGCRLPDWGSLTFEEPDHEAFPALRLCYRAAEMGGTAPTVLNAADEVAVEAFLGGRLPFPGIVEVVRETLEALPPVPADSLEAVAAADERARETARELLAGRVS